MASMKESKVSNMKSGLQLFSRMHVSSQVRNGDMDIFFQHKNHSWPPSLAENNFMALGEGGGGGIVGFTLFVIGEIIFFVMREFKALFSVTCDGSISRDA